MMQFLRTINNVEAVLYAVTILIVMGTVNIFSASFVHAGQTLNDSYFFLKRHLLSLVVGLAAMYIAWRIDYRKLKRLLPFLVLATLAFLAVVPFAGLEANGARRWLNIAGFTFQPSELAKLTAMLTAASYLGALADRGRKATLLSVPFLLSIVMGAMVYKQPDLGTAAIIVGVCLVLYLIVGLPRLQFMIMGFIFSGSVVYLTLAASYRAQRISAWLNPWAYQDSTGYQTVQSLLAIGSGGFWGSGLGMGASKFYYLPEAHTDFAFAVLCQEMGFVGACLVFVLLGAIAFYGGRITKDAADSFGKLLAAGTVTLIVGQAIANIAMVSGLLPVIGVPLPFISYGGTSLIINLVAVGLMLNVGRQKPAKDERQDELEVPDRRPRFRVIKNT